MILRMIALEVMEQNGIDPEKRQQMAKKIEEDYVNEVNSMFITREKGKRTISLDPEFLVDQELRNIENDSLLKT